MSKCPICKHVQEDCFCDWQEFVDHIEALEAQVKKWAGNSERNGTAMTQARNDLAELQRKHSDLVDGLKNLQMIGESVTDEVGSLANDLANTSCKHRDSGHCVDCIVTYLVDSLTAPFIMKIEALLEQEARDE